MENLQKILKRVVMHLYRPVKNVIILEVRVFLVHTVVKKEYSIPMMAGIALKIVDFFQIFGQIWPNIYEQPVNSWKRMILHRLHVKRVISHIIRIQFSIGRINVKNIYFWQILMMMDLDIALKNVDFLQRLSKSWKNT